MRCQKIYHRDNWLEGVGLDKPLTICEPTFSFVYSSQYELTPFVVSDERAVWYLNQTLNTPLIASSAYQKLPTKDTHCTPNSLEQGRVLTNLKFDNRSREHITPGTINHSLYLIKLRYCPSYLEGTS